MVGPIAIRRQNRRQVLSPDQSVAGRDHVDLQAGQPIQGLQHRLAVGHDDVRVIRLGLLHHDGQIDFVVEPLAGGVVLAEGVHREQQLLLGHVGGHRLGPVDHRRFDEPERPPPERNLLAGGDDANLPRRRVEMLAERRGAFLVAHQRGLRHRLQHLRQRAGVVQLGMVADDVIDPRQIAQRRDVLQQLDRRTGP